MSRPEIAGGFEFYLVEVFGAPEYQDEVETYGVGDTLEEAKESAFTRLYYIHDHYVSDGITQVWKNVDNEWLEIEEEAVE